MTVTHFETKERSFLVFCDKHFCIGYDLLQFQMKSYNVHDLLSTHSGFHKEMN